MAKKRGRKKKSEPVNNHELPGGWWRQIVAVVFMVIAVVFVVSWFDNGSDAAALKFIHSSFLKLIGFTYYLIPALLVYLAVKIFRAPNNRVDPAVWVASALMIIWFSGVFGVPSYGKAEPTGGMLGAALNNVMVGALDKGVSVFIYIMLILITAMFMYAATPAEIMRRIKSTFASTKSDEDAENARVMRRTRGDEEEQPRRRGLRVNNSSEVIEEKPQKHGLLRKKDNTIEEEKPAPAPVETSRSALTAVSDPNWKMPPLSLLNKKRSPADPGDTDKNAHIIEDTLNQFGIEVDVEEANVGPRITQYTLRPPSGVKVAKIAQLDKELALSLAKDKIRIEAPIPGTRTVGVELPNDKAASVGLHELLQSNEWTKIIRDKPLAFALGKDIAGKTVVGDLAKMPHLLIAGTTGSGKSVMTNTLISSLLFHNAPSDLRLIIVDPKQVEMAAYQDIPQLLTPVITDVAKALSAMKWAVNEMERRYSVMAQERVKNIVDYNAKMAKKQAEKPEGAETTGEEQKSEGKMPYIVVIVDEMADLMMMAGKELEMLIVRIAQKGRASGIHLVLATQRPEVKVVTGLIKANIPGRIAFAVNNGIDSRVMLDMTGAEKLLGSGDMLFLTTEMMGKPKRVQGAYVSDDEISNVTDFLRQQAPPDYNEDVISQQVSIKGMGGEMIEMGGGSGGSIERQAMEIAIQAGKISTSLLQRRLSIGYGRASGIIDHLEEMGMVGPAPGGNKPREILISDISEFPE